MSTNAAILLQAKKDFVINIFNQALELRFMRPAPLDFDYLQELLSMVESASVYDLMDEKLSGDIAANCLVLWKTMADSPMSELLRGAVVLLDEISFGEYNIGKYPRR